MPLDPARLGPYSALLFDCDGTLVASATLHHRAFASAVAADCGAALPWDWYAARTGVSRDALIDQFAASFGVALDAAAVAAHSARVFHDGVAELRQIDAVAAVARAHHRRVPMAVASGGQRDIVEATLRATGLRDLFDAVVTIDDTGRGKPAPDLFLEAARRLGVAPGGCVVFEDSAEGLEAARRAGMRAIDVRPALAGLGNAA